MNNNLILIIINIFLLLLICSISVYNIIITKKLHTKDNELKSLQNHNNILSNLYDDIRSFKHDFNNIVLTIGGFIYSNDIDGLKQYYTSLSADCQKENNEALLTSNVINNSGVYNLLVEKYKKAYEANIKINFDYLFNFENLYIPIYEFSRILGILLDNAIEAASNSDEKILNLSFRDSYSNKTKIIIIENTYNNENIDLSKIFKKGITTKEKHSGLGLWKVNQILKKYKNAKLITTAENGIFRQQLEIYY